jgi:hypothetical protein
MSNPHIHLGEIVDINDPLKQGRARVRVFGFFEDLEIEDIFGNTPLGTSIYYKHFNTAIFLL